MGKNLDLVGKRFGSLTVLNYEYSTKGGKRMWRCVCDCGNESLVQTSNLTTGHIKHCQQCGYKALAEKRTTHGKRRTNLYTKWCSMRRRCEEKSCKSYKYYGAKGIKVCEEWKDPEKFFAWAESHGYEEGLEIDRIDVKGDYCPENCRFITRIENANNKSNNRYVSYNGETKTLAEMCRKYNLTYNYISKLLRKGLSFGEAKERFEAKAVAAEAKTENEPKEGLFGEE